MTGAIRKCELANTAAEHILGKPTGLSEARQAQPPESYSRAEFASADVNIFKWSVRNMEKHSSCTKEPGPTSLGYQH
eukprot:6211300-Pleurochrysis_carterae.AAC.1